MELRKTLYWTTTSLLAAGLALSSFKELTGAPEIVEVMQRLGYPNYVTPLLGIWKLAGAAVILAPDLSRLKEWAYAGIFFDLTGALFSHLACDDAPVSLIFPLLFLALLLPSWGLRPASRRLGWLWRRWHMDARLASGGVSSAILLATLPMGCGPARAQLSASTDTDTPASSKADEVLSFWRAAGPQMWFAKDAAFDQQFRERFLSLHEAAAHGALQDWSKSAEGSLALVILLDQFPRNAFRGKPRMYDTDAQARALADHAIHAGFDQQVEEALRVFMYLPFGHSEDLRDQERSVELTRKLGEPHLAHALGHRDIIRRFGRFPHRNPILGRPMRPEEQKYLDDGGFKG
jgi:uncharacterized protein (DUF924 family)